MSRYRLAICLLLFIALPTHAVGFDCKKARSDVEKAICADAKLAALDDDLAVAYAAALKADPSAPQLRAEQSQWLRLRDWTCARRPGKGAASDIGICLAELYRVRIGALERAQVTQYREPAPGASRGAAASQGGIFPDVWHHVFDQTELSRSRLNSETERWARITAVSRIQLKVFGWRCA